MYDFNQYRIMIPHHIVQMESGGVPDTPRLCASKEQALEIFSSILTENGFNRVEGESVEFHVAAYEHRRDHASSLVHPDREDTFNHDDDAVRMWEVACEGLEPLRLQMSNIATTHLQGMTALRDLSTSVSQALQRGVEHRRKELTMLTARIDRTAVELSQALIEQMPDYQHRPSAKEAGWMPLVELLKVLYHPDFFWSSGAGITDLKYLELRLDTRDLGCLVGNRYGRQISAAILQQGLVAPAFRSMNENNPAELISALGEIIKQRFAAADPVIVP